MTPDQIYTLTLVSLFVLAICFCFYLYHLAHGRDVDAVEAGGNLVISAMQKSGQMSSTFIDEGDMAFNIQDEDDSGLDENQAMRERVLARADIFQAQQDEKELDKVMEDMNEKV